MTVQATPSFVDYVGDDVTLVFNFTFRVDDVSWLFVDFTDDFDTFTVNLDQELNPGGTVEYLVAPPSPGMGGPDPSFRVLRAVPATQNLAYTRYDPFDSLSHENALDKLTMILQDQVTRIDTVEADATAGILANTLLITTGVSPGHQHVEADIIDLGNYTSRSVDEDITGFWEFINVSGLAIYDAGKAAGGRISTQTGAMELLPLLANTHVRVNGPLAVSRAGVTADQLEIQHNGADVLFTATNAADLNMVGFTGRLIQGAESYAYLSDIAASGLLPPAADLGAHIYWTGAAYAPSGATDTGQAGILWDPAGTILAITDINPGQTVIRMGGVGSGSTNYTALRMDDQTGANFFLWRHDYGLSSPNHELTLESSQFGTLYEFENEGNMWFCGSELAARLAIIPASNQVRIAQAASLYIDGIAAPNGEQSGFGQLWVDSADESLNYKGFGIANITLGAGGGGPVTQLEDSSANIRLTAELGGIVNLRSDGNGVEAKALQFTQQDGTILGRMSFSGTLHDMRLTNEVAAGALSFIMTGTEMYRLEPDPNTAFDTERHRWSDDTGNVCFVVNNYAQNDIGVGAQVADDGGVMLPVGYNVMPPKLSNSGRQYDLSDNGRMCYKDSGVLVIMNTPTVTNVLPNGWTIGIANLGASANIRIGPNTGSLHHIAADGTITTIGFGSTWEMTPGFVGTLWKEDDSNFWLWGNTAITGL